jgi:hypothetical protein
MRCARSPIVCAVTDGAGLSEAEFEALSLSEVTDDGTRVPESELLRDNVAPLDAEGLGWKKNGSAWSISPPAQTNQPPVPPSGRSHRVSRGSGS